MGPFTPQTQDSTVYTLAAQLMADAANDADRARIDRALDLVARCERVAGVPGLWLVYSQTDDTKAYTVDAATCSCPDFQKRGGLCKHRAAVTLFQQAERAEVDMEQERDYPGCPGIMTCPCDCHDVEPGDVIPDDHRCTDAEQAECCIDCDDGGRESPEGMRRRCSNCPLIATWTDADRERGFQTPTITAGAEDSILDLWPVPDGEPCEIGRRTAGGRITVLPYTPAQAAIASELYADEPQGAA